MDCGGRGREAGANMDFPRPCPTLMDLMRTGPRPVLLALCLSADTYHPRGLCICVLVTVGPPPPLSLVQAHFLLCVCVIRNIFGGARNPAHGLTLARQMLHAEKHHFLTPGYCLLAVVRVHRAVAGRRPDLGMSSISHQAHHLHSGHSQNRGGLNRHTDFPSEQACL